MSAIIPSIAADTTVGTVALTVSHLDRSRAFYETVLGLTAHELDDGGLALGVADEPALVWLLSDSVAPRLDPRATGLFHLAVLTPSRRELAYALARLARSRWPVSGASDHLVSEALYLNDPDGNGIEIYRDRERSEWRTDDDGQLAMATLRLDLKSLAGELHDAPPVSDRMPAGTRMGHVHLQVSDIPAAEDFYHGVLGFDVTVRGYPGALFVSAGGYHHHIGLNTWNSAGAAPPPPGAVGLRAFDVRLPDRDELDRVLARVSAAGLTAETLHGATAVRDPSGNAVLLRSAGPDRVLR
ncbi:MAG TPA: VOC family protein, partial [Solirubrobacteraceae bacterium]|nr:VOC family protein [Solirubrobacteraceae bacterium]